MIHIMKILALGNRICLEFLKTQKIDSLSNQERSLCLKPNQLGSVKSETVEMVEAKKINIRPLRCVQPGVLSLGGSNDLFLSFFIVHVSIRLRGVSFRVSGNKMERLNKKN